MQNNCKEEPTAMSYNGEHLESKRPQSIFFRLERRENHLYSIQHKHLPQDIIGFDDKDLIVRK